MTTPLAGKRILIVEDEYFIAADLHRALLAAGAAPLRPVGRLAEGLTLAEAEPLDAAVLDVNLGDAASYAIADALCRRRIPYLFLTGYDAWALPARHQAAPRLGKPCSLPVAMDAIARLLSAETRG